MTQWTLHVQYEDGKSACLPLATELVTEYTSESLDVDWDSIYGEVSEQVRQLADDTNATVVNIYGVWRP